MEWIYLTLKDGKLYDDDGYLVFLNTPYFKDSQEAGQWLEDNDERATVR